MSVESERYALVAGASSGLGFEVAQYLLEEGFTVIGVSRTGAGIRDDLFIDLKLDLCDEDSVESLNETLEEEVFGLEVIVNCIGVFDMISIDQLSTESLMDHLQTHVVGAFHLLKSVRDFLLEGETHIIHVSSLAAQKGLPSLSAYCASKAGMERLIESCREEWKEEGVRFTTLVPGAVDTPLWDNLSEQEPDFNREEMLAINDFIYVFDMVIKSPPTVYFPQLTFAHRDGALG